jgi:hypothetical protein
VTFFVVDPRIHRDPAQKGLFRTHAGPILRRALPELVPLSFALTSSLGSTIGAALAGNLIELGSVLLAAMTPRSVPIDRSLKSAIARVAHATATQTSNGRCSHAKNWPLTCSDGEGTAA